MFRTDSFEELSALHKAVTAGKFSDTAGELAGDPTLAGVSGRLYDELCTAQEKREKGKGKDMQDWRRITTSQGRRGQWRTAVIAARSDTVFMSAGQEERISMAKCYLSPFTCTETELKEFIDAVDKKDGAQTLDALFKKHSFDSAMLLDCSYDLGKRQAKTVLMLSGMKVCHIVFSGVTRFELTAPAAADGSVPDDTPVMKKYSARGCRLDASFSSVSGKVTLTVDASGVDYWI